MYVSDDIEEDSEEDNGSDTSEAYIYRKALSMNIVQRLQESEDSSLYNPPCLVKSVRHSCTSTKFLGLAVIFVIIFVSSFLEQCSSFKRPISSRRRCEGSSTGDQALLAAKDVLITIRQCISIQADALDGRIKARRLRRGPISLPYEIISVVLTYAVLAVRGGYKDSFEDSYAIVWTLKPAVPKITKFLISN